MTQQDDITQRVLTTEQRKEFIRRASFISEADHDTRAAFVDEIARAALASAPVDPEATEVDFLVRVFENLDTWRAEDWNELLERRPAILAMLRPLVLASAPVAGEAQPSDADITKTIRVLMDEARHTRCADGEMGVRVQDVMIARAVLARYGHTPLPIADAAPQASAEPQQYTHSEVFGPMESAWNAALDQAAAVAKRISDKYAFGHYGNETDTADEIEREILALKQPQADKDGGQQRKRYVVLKSSRSRYAYVNDTQEGRSINRFDVLKGDGWKYAHEFADRMNKEHERAALSAPQAEQGERDA